MCRVVIQCIPDHIKMGQIHVVPVNNYACTVHVQTTCSSLELHTHTHTFEPLKLTQKMRTTKLATFSKLKHFWYILLLFNYN